MLKKRKKMLARHCLYSVMSLEEDGTYSYGYRCLHEYLDK